MKKKIFLDTSVWIEYFKNTKANLPFDVDKYLLADSVYINGIIIAELIQGLKIKKEEQLFASLLSALIQKEIVLEDWYLAGEISSNLRKKGITLPLTDIAIASHAIKNNYLVVSYDKHFSHIETLEFKLLKKQ